MSHGLEEARRKEAAAGTACWHRPEQPMAMVINVNYQCETLRDGAPKHAAASRQLGLHRPALFLPLFPGCDGRCRSVVSIGNVIAHYVMARAAAQAGGLDFLLMMRDCPQAHGKPILADSQVHDTAATSSPRDASTTAGAPRAAAPAEGSAGAEHRRRTELRSGRGRRL